MPIQGGFFGSAGGPALWGPGRGRQGWRPVGVVALHSPPAPEAARASLLAPRWRLPWRRGPAAGVPQADTAFSAWRSCFVCHRLGLLSIGVNQ